ncbi:ACT domain-containing protein, partial [Streptomyces sp. DSM 41493]
LRAAPHPPAPAGPTRRTVAVVAEGSGHAGAGLRLAGCCTPVPPDEVTGFTVRGGTVTVHRSHCPAVERMVTSGRRPVAVHWRVTDGADAVDYRVTLRAESFSRPHLLADLTEVIAAEGAAVISAAVEPPHEQRVRHTYTLQLSDAGRLPELMRAMRRVPGVYDVERAGRQAAPAPL